MPQCPNAVPPAPPITATEGATEHLHARKKGNRSRGSDEWRVDGGLLRNADEKPWALSGWNNSG